jgi:predicted DNA-binding mobile mystery protein A
MSVKKVVITQYQDIVNRAAIAARELYVPKEGWIRTVRKALRMSGVQLAVRMRVTKSLISNIEKAELSGKITIKKIQQIAEAMDCQFVYAVVPKKNVQEIINYHARKKAQEIVEKANKHMALEDQTLSNEEIEYEIDRLKQEILQELPSEIWNANDRRNELS